MITREDLRYCLELAKVDVGSYYDLHLIHLTWYANQFSPEIKQFSTTSLWEDGEYARRVSARLGIKRTRWRWAYTGMNRRGFSDSIRTPCKNSYAKRISALLSLTNSSMKIGHLFDG